jgi:hypothetical protein
MTELSRAELTVAPTVSTLAFAQPHATCRARAGRMLWHELERQRRVDLALALRE